MSHQADCCQQLPLLLPSMHQLVVSAAVVERYRAHPLNMRSSFPTADHPRPWMLPTAACASCALRRPCRLSCLKTSRPTRWGGLVCRGRWGVCSMCPAAMPCFGEHLDQPEGEQCVAAAAGCPCQRLMCSARGTSGTTGEALLRSSQRAHPPPVPIWQEAREARGATGAAHSYADSGGASEVGVDRAVGGAVSGAVVESARQATCACSRGVPLAPRFPLISRHSLLGH